MKGRQGGKNSSSKSKSLYSIWRDSGSDRIRFDSAEALEEAEKRAALLGQLEDSTNNGERGTTSRDRVDIDTSSGGGEESAQRYRDLSDARQSMGSADSNDTTSTSHTVFRNTETTNEFSTSYHPQHYHGHHARPSEYGSNNYKTGSIIVNALMWPIGSGKHGARNSSSANNNSYNSNSMSRSDMSAGNQSSSKS